MKKLLLLIAMMIAMPLNIALAADYAYQSVPEQKIRITVDYLNVRTGPGTDYPIVRVVKKNQVFNIIGALTGADKSDIWYVTLLDDGSVGVVSKDYVECFDFKVDNVKIEDEADSAKLLDMLNAMRTENRLPKFKENERLNGIAQLKAEDMAENLLLDHVSKRYGTPFVMLKESGVLYKSASETIERGVNSAEAYDSIISTPAGRSNITNTRFNSVGIGMSVGSDGYYYFALMFIEE